MELGLSPSSLAHWPLSRTQAHLPVPQGLQDGHVLNDHYTGTCVSDATLGGSGLGGGDGIPNGLHDDLNQGQCITFNAVKESEPLKYVILDNKMGPT